MAMEAGLGGLVFLRPILAFLMVLVVMYALLAKTKLIGDNQWVNLLIAFITSTVFVSAGSVRSLVLGVIPWFVVLFLALFFIIVLTSLIGKSGDIAGKGLGWFFVILLLLIFFIGSIKVFTSSFGSYIPGPYYGQDADPQLLYFFDWLYSYDIFGTFLLILIGGAVSWILVKGK